MVSEFCEPWTNELFDQIDMLLDVQLVCGVMTPEMVLVLSCPLVQPEPLESLKS